MTDKAQQCSGDMKKGEFQAKAPIDLGSRKTLKTEKAAFPRFTEKRKCSMISGEGLRREAENLPPSKGATSLEDCYATA
ncbi:hypothetical protein [Agrobacterium vitis]|uniref:Uncharacterized protein n=1 Tax=Agrobacterium vitis TaxID=373 RepID=A0AAE2US84_AGRVI|nr:hypothetical protein [Agrobacterium vitis]MBF2715668.1 hypothetical protein [Agrobacterium vitis]